MVTMMMMMKVRRFEVDDDDLMAVLTMENWRDSWSKMTTTTTMMGTGCGPNVD